MDMLEITGSSNVAAVGWEHRYEREGSNFGRLRVQFRGKGDGKGGGLYEYADVPESVYKELVSSHSPGSYFHEFIKSKESYAYRKLDPNEEEKYGPSNA